MFNEKMFTCSLHSSAMYLNFNSNSNSAWLLWKISSISSLCLTQREIKENIIKCARINEEDYNYLLTMNKVKKGELEGKQVK